MNVKDDGGAESYLNSYDYKRYKFIAVKSQHLATVNTIKEADGAIPSDVKLVNFTIMSIK